MSNRGLATSVGTGAGTAASTQRWEQEEVGTVTKDVLFIDSPPPRSAAAEHSQCAAVPRPRSSPSAARPPPSAARPVGASIARVGVGVAAGVAARVRAAAARVPLQLRQLLLLLLYPLLDLLLQNHNPRWSEPAGWMLVHVYLSCCCCVLCSIFSRTAALSHELPAAAARLRRGGDGAGMGGCTYKFLTVCLKKL